jgi:hypothetical protein
MMLDITVKTLDGRNRTFSVPDNITVRQFKEKISGSIEIDADTQRLIFQGRVLVDEKKIDDYNVNGKTIHVVQKPPPTVHSATSTHAEPAPGRNREEMTRHEGSSFVLGSFSVPSDSADAAAHVHNVVRQMLSGVGDIGHSPRATAQAPGDGSSAGLHVGRSTSLQSTESQNCINQAFQMLSSVSRTINMLDNADDDPGATAFHAVMSGIHSYRQGDDAAGGTQSSPSGHQFLSVSVLSSLLDEVLRLHDRLRPHLIHYQQMLNDDPDFTDRESDVQTAQRLSNLSSEVLHFLSHAYHHISDLIVDLNSQPPRQLRVQSAATAAIVQQTIPVQINVAHVPMTSSTASGLSQENASNSDSATGDQLAQNMTSTLNANGSASSIGPQRTSHRISASGSVPLASPAMPPGFQLFMEMTPGPSIFSRPWTPSSMPTQGEAATSASSSQAGTTSMRPDLPLPRSPAAFPPGDFLQNVIQMATAAALRGQPGAQVMMMSTASNVNPAVSPVPVTVTADQNDRNTSFGTVSTSSASFTTTLSSAPQAQQLHSRVSSASFMPNVPPSTSVPSDHLFPVDPYLPCRSRHFRVRHGSQVADRVTETNTQAREVNNTSGTNDVFASMMQGITSELIQTMQGLSHRSIAQFLGQLGSEYSMPHGEGLLTDLFHIVADQLAFADLMTIFFGQPGPLECLREPLHQFVADRILMGEEATDANIDHAVDRLVNYMQPDINAFAGELPTRNNIDYLATVTRFIRIHLNAAVCLIMNATAHSGFARSLYELCRTVIHGYVVLSRYCLVGGQGALESLLQDRLQTISTEVSPAMQNTMSQVAIQQLRQMVPCLTEDNIIQYIVYHSSSSVAVTESGSSDNSFESACDDATDTFSQDTHKEQLKAMDTTGDPGSEETSVDVDMQVRPARINPTLLSFLSAQPDADQDSDIQVVYGSEDWHSAVPTAWIPVITRDIVRQRRQAPQPPLSDAYLSGMPSKRRRVMTRHRHREEFDEFAVIIPEVINRAAERAGVRPITSENQIHRDVLDSTQLCAAFQQQLNENIHQRLSTDSDYIHHKYPSIEKFFNSH